MPQVKEPLIRTLVREAIKEAELSVGDDNTKFDIKVSVSNPQSETKLGIRIQLKPKSEAFLFTDPDKKGALSVAIMKKLNSSLGQFDIQVSKDTDAETVDPTVLGFFIPLSQIKNMIVKSLGGKESSEPTPPSTPKSSVSKPPVPKPKPPIDDSPPKKSLNEMRVRDLKEISGVVIKEDFYNFINAGQNVLRTLEENGLNHINGKKYLEYLVKHNIM